jgi:hypothetical protein
MLFALAVGGGPLHHGEHGGGCPDTRDGQTPKGGGTVLIGIVRSPLPRLPRVKPSGPCAATGFPLTCPDHPETRKRTTGSKWTIFSGRKYITPGLALLIP